MSQGLTILFFADTHLGFDQPVKLRSKRPRRGPDFFKNYDSVLQKASMAGVDLVIHGGDLFDRPHVHSSIVNRAYDRLFEFAEHGIPIVLIPGNHDRSVFPSGLFLNHPGIHIIREPSVINFQLKGVSINIAGFPFIRDIGREIRPLIKELSSQLPKAEINLLCMHQAVEGAVVGPAHYKFRPGPRVIKMEDLTGPYDAFLSGHIHPHQILSTPSGTPFIYPGSIERTSFAEKDEIKGYLLLKMIQSEKPQVNFFELPTRPMYSITIDATMETQSQVLQYLQKNINPLPKNSIIKITSPSDQISKWLRARAIDHLFTGNMIFQIQHTWLAMVRTRRRRSS